MRHRALDRTRFGGAGRALRIHRSGHTPVSLRLDPAQRYTFGRTTRARVLFPDGRVSRTHGELEHVETGWVFTDLASANGSFQFRVCDLLRTETDRTRLPCLRLAPGQSARILPGEGMLLGCREAWIELLEHPPADAFLCVEDVNLPSVRATIEAMARPDAETPDLGLPPLLEPPAPRPVSDLRG